MTELSRVLRSDRGRLDLCRLEPAFSGLDTHYRSCKFQLEVDAMESLQPLTWNLNVKFDRLEHFGLEAYLTLSP